MMVSERLGTVRIVKGGLLRVFRTPEATENHLKITENLSLRPKKLKILKNIEKFLGFSIE